jgi:putative hydrolase of the HAD superfamily
MVKAQNRCILFDWGDTLMRVFSEFKGPMATWPHVESLPHAEEILLKLRSDWTIGLATNAVDSDESEIREALELVNLHVLIDKVYCFQRIGFSKPSPEFFEVILGDLGLEPQKVLMVGDSFEADVLGANQSGIRALWFNHRSDEERTGELYKTIHDLRELDNALMEWGY